MPGLTINLVNTKKSELEKEIGILLDAFEKETDVLINKVESNRAHTKRVVVYTKNPIN